MNMQDTVKYFFLKEKLIPEQGFENLDLEIELLESGIIDSLNVLKLICYLEEQFKIEVLDMELTPDNFVNLRTICELLEKKGC